jgi:hypothetical protein
VVVYSGDANYATATSACGAPGEASVVTAVPTINVDKTATPLTEPEPGGDFTFNVVVTNTSPEVLVIRSLTDNVYGDLTTRANSTCTNAIGTTLQPSPGPGNTYSCSFTAPFTGNGGDSQTDTVTVTATNPSNVTVTDTDDAVVSLTDVLPIIAVNKTATPASLPQPGGQFTFNVVVTNLSNEPVTITSLTDNVYGDLNGRGTCATGATLAAAPGPGNTYSCSFTGNFTGVGGAQQTDIVTANAVDNDNNTATAQDDAVVTITNLTPAILVEKSASPASRPEPGGTFQFNVVVSNTGPEALTITSLTDDIYGNIATQGTCTTAIGTVLQPGASYTCSFPGNFTGNAGATQTDIVTVVGRDTAGISVSDTDDATVTLTGVPPTVDITKTPSPSSLPEPGGQFTFNFVVTNTSNETVTITQLTDDVYGDLNGRGTCATGAVLAPGAQYRCAFTATFTGPPGATQTDTVTVVVVDDNGEQATDTDNAVITITDVPPVIVVQKTATPLVRNEPGGSFTFDVVITNTSPEIVTIDSLTDNVYGNLNGRGTCATGAVLAANGGTYRCSFTGDFFGDAGATQTDVVTASGVDNEGSRTTARDDAIVRIVDVPPTVNVIKDADPTSRPEPGGSFTFSVTVVNTSVEPVTVVSLIDDVYGNLNGKGTCAVGAHLAPGAAYKCQFTVEFRGVAGASQIDHVTATVVDNENNRASATDEARITLTPAGTPVVVLPQQLSRTGGDVGGPARLAFALLLAGLLMVGATMRSRGQVLALPEGFVGWTTRFSAAPTGAAVRRLLGGLRGGSTAWPDLDDDLDDGLDDDDPDDDPPPGPQSGGPQSGGPGSSGGGSGATAPREITDADWLSPLRPAPTGTAMSEPDGASSVSERTGVVAPNASSWLPAPPAGIEGATARVPRPRSQGQDLRITRLL